MQLIIIYHIFMLLVGGMDLDETLSLNEYIDLSVNIRSLVGKILK